MRKTRTTDTSVYEDGKKVQCFCAKKKPKWANEWIKTATVTTSSIYKNEVNWSETEAFSHRYTNKVGENDAKRKRAIYFVGLVCVCGRCERQKERDRESVWVCLNTYEYEYKNECYNKPYK